MKFEDSQRGSANLKLLRTLLIFFIVGNALVNYLPVAYNSENIRQEMHTAVLQGMSLPPTMGNPVEVTKKRIQNAMKINNIPSYAFLEVKQVNNIIQARVAFIQPIAILPFGLYDYNYQFDYTTYNGNYLGKE
jgi:hypothetical protein